MRLSLLCAALILPASAASAPAPAGDMPVFDPIPAERADCPPISRYHMAKRKHSPGERASAQKLTELPPADAYLAVSRRIGRCEVPIIVRYGIGGE